MADDNEVIISDDTIEDSHQGIESQQSTKGNYRTSRQSKAKLQIKKFLETDTD